MTKKQKQTEEGVKVVSAEEAEREQPDLPPPGYEQYEELRRRIDELEAANEALSAQKEIYKLDPSVFREDREILNKVDLLDVTNPQPGRVYKWVYYGHNGQMVMKMKYLGWRVVQSDDPECPELKEADNTRRIGDTLLMWVPAEKHAEIEERSERLRMQQQLGVEAALRELGEKHRKNGLIVHTNLEEMPGRKEGESMLETLKQKAARKANMSRVNDMLHQGNVPGMPSPKGGR